MEIIFIGSKAANIGKTSTLVSLATCLRGYGFNVLVVDLSGDLTLIHSKGGYDRNFKELWDEWAEESPIKGEENSETPTHTVLDVLTGQALLPDVIVHNDMYDYIPAPINYRKLYDNYIPLTNCIESRYILSAALREKTKYVLADKYDFILIDAFRGSIVTDSAIIASDSIILPCDPSAYSCLGALGIISDVKRLETYGVETKIDGMLINRFNPARAFDRTIYEELIDTGKNAGIGIYKTRIRNSRIVPKARYEQRSILNYRGRGHGTEDAMRFTLEFLARRGLGPKQDIN